MSREGSYAPKSPDLSSFYAAPEPVRPPNQNSQPPFLPYTGQQPQWSSYPQQQFSQPQQLQQPPYYQPPAHLRSPSQQPPPPPQPTSQPAQPYYVPPDQTPYLNQPQQPQRQFSPQQEQQEQQQQQQQQQTPFAVQPNYYPPGQGPDAYYQQQTPQPFPQEPLYRQGLQQVLQPSQPPAPPPPAPGSNLEPSQPMPPRKAAVAAAAANAAAAAAEAAQSSDGGSNGGVTAAKPAMAPSPVKTKFPTARIKRIMQADEEVGKVSQQTPIAVGKALELFMVSIVSESAEVARAKNSKRVTAQMLRQVVEAGEQWDFLRDIVKKVDPEEKPHGGRPRGSTGVPAATGDGGGGSKPKLESDSDTEQPKKRGRPGRKKKEA